MRSIRLVSVASYVCAMVACGGSSPTSPSPTPTPTPTPTVTTFTIQGQVTEPSPFTSNRIAGAKVEVVDGPNAGKSATTDASGNFTLSALTQSGFTLRASADGYHPVSVGVTLTSNLTQNFQLPLTGPRTRFGPGQWRVNVDIAPGRYYADPATSGCYWERLRGLSGAFGDILANDFVGFNAGQLIVDIAGSDVAFETDSECGTWFNTPRHGAQTTITPGTWLIGSQITPGTYTASVSSGCYWERLRGFSGTLSDISANDFVSTAGVRSVSLASGDVGFSTDSSCGTWTRTGSVTSAVVLQDAMPSPARIAVNRELYRNQVRR